MNSDYDEEVVANENLNLRKTGSGNAPVIGSIRKEAVIHVDGPVNAAGYFPCHVTGWMQEGNQTVFADAAIGDMKTVRAMVFPGAKIELVHEGLCEGMSHVLVRGWVSRLWVKPVKIAKELA